MNLYQFTLLFRVWICTCEDPTHTGDDVMCPKHGFGAAIVRGVTLFVISLVVVIVLFSMHLHIEW